MDRQDTTPLFNEDVFSSIYNANDSFSALMTLPDGLSDLDDPSSGLVFENDLAQPQHLQPSLQQQTVAVNNIPQLTNVKMEHLGQQQPQQFNNNNNYGISTTPPELMTAVPYNAVHDNMVHDITRTMVSNVVRFNDVQVQQRQQQQQQPSNNVAITQNNTALGTRPWSPAILQTADMIETLYQEDSNAAVVVVPYKFKMEQKVAMTGAGPLLPRSNSLDVSTLKDYPGKHGFKLDILPENKHKNKHCYSSQIESLYTTPYASVEIRVSLADWSTMVPDTSIRLCCVYHDPHNRTIPVARCFQCMKDDIVSDDNNKKYIVQICNSGAVHDDCNARQIVTMPLSQPQLGQDFITLLVRVSCRTSCVGGPNRRPFVLLFSLIEGGVEVGRRIVPTKCVQAPARDMRNDEKTFAANVELVKQGGSPKRRTAPKNQAGPSSSKRSILNIVTTLSSDSDTERTVTKKFKKTAPAAPLPADRALPQGFATLIVPVETVATMRRHVLAETALLTYQGFELAAGKHVLEVLQSINKSPPPPNPQ